MFAGSRSLPPPPIAPVFGGQPRPIWSVMLPVRDRTDFIGQSVASVLAQDPGPAEMEIWLVDNSTRRLDWSAFLPPAARGRVQAFRQPAPVGLAENWNTCVAHARGQLVHLLHDDDWVLPGFYAKLGAMARDRPDIGLFCCRAELVDAGGVRTGASSFWAGWREPTHDSIAMLNTHVNPLRCPAVVVRRDTYATVGGFRPELTFYTDWEMWLRAAHTAGAWMADDVLAAYREHCESITARVGKSGEGLEDLLRLGQVMTGIPGFSLPALRRYVARTAVDYACYLRHQFQDDSALAYERIWRRTATPSQRLDYCLERSLGRLWRGVRRRLHPN